MADSTALDHSDRAGPRMGLAIWAEQP